MNVVHRGFINQNKKLSLTFVSWFKVVKLPERPQKCLWRFLPKPSSQPYSSLRARSDLPAPPCPSYCARPAGWPCKATTTRWYSPSPAEQQPAPVTQENQKPKLLVSGNVPSMLRSTHFAVQHGDISVPCRSLWLSHTSQSALNSHPASFQFCIFQHTQQEQLDQEQAENCFLVMLQMLT